MLSFLERNIQKCPRQIKENCINALVRPVMEYGCCVWDPHKIYQINKLEKLNKRAARFIRGNYRLEHGETQKNMKDLGWPPLQERRARLKVTMFDKTINNLIHTPQTDLKPLMAPRRKLNYFIPRSNIDCHLHSFFPSSIRLWNSLPNTIKAANSLAVFKSFVERHTISTSYFN